MNEEEQLQKDILFQIDMHLYNKYNKKIAGMNDHLGDIYTYRDIEEVEQAEKDEKIYLLTKAIKELQKEIENYQILKDDIEGHRIVYVDTPEFEENYISKDKIRKEIEEIKNCRLSTCDEQINKSLKERYEIEDEICEYFEELLQSGQQSDQEGGQEDE